MKSRRGSSPVISPAQLGHSKSTRQLAELLGSIPHLKADQTNSGQFRQVSKMSKGK